MAVSWSEKVKKRYMAYGLGWVPSHRLWSPQHRMISTRSSFWCFQVSDLDWKDVGLGLRKRAAWESCRWTLVPLMRMSYDLENCRILTGSWRNLMTFPGLQTGSGRWLSEGDAGSRPYLREWNREAILFTARRELAPRVWFHFKLKLDQGKNLD